MARGGKLGFSYRRTTLVVCSFNIVIGLVVLRSIISSFYAQNSDGSYSAVKYTPDQIKHMEKSLTIRSNHHPLRLIRLIKALKGDKMGNAVGLTPHHKQKLTAEVLEVLRNLTQDASPTIQREAVEKWRKEKLKEAEIKSTVKKERILVKVLKNWDSLCDEIGLWIPPEIIHKEHKDKPEDAEEEEILAGREVPPECHVELHTDYDGAAVRWGLTHPKESAADCCQACFDQAKNAKEGEPKCNIWVYCPAEGGCYSPDIYKHNNQECWLKYSETPRLNFKGKYTDQYRSSHRDAPLIVPWVSGVITS